MTHGLSNTQVYIAWCDMKRRCLNPAHEKYPHYGGRGIIICDRWLTFINFFRDVGHPPAPGLQLDRINNDGNYESGNVN